MNGGHLSLILLPTLRCNADCEYCFEYKSSHVMTLDEFEIILNKVIDYVDRMHIDELTVYWQGGEVLTIEPEWFMRVKEIVDKKSQSSNKTINNELQTNLIGYGEKWNRVFREVFNNQCGSSLDFPNLYRKVTGMSPDRFNDLWVRKYREAVSNGIGVGIISLPNDASFKIGARRFYSYYTEELGMGGFQVNAPFPGISADGSKPCLPLDSTAYGDFARELIDVWMEHGHAQGVRLAPFAGILEYFLTGDKSELLCGMRHDCSREFFSIGPDGSVSQCDCWVSSYPEFHFGNVFECGELMEIMDGPVRRLFRDRPVKLMEKGECVDCEYLTICHGGCAIRTYSSTGNFFVKDPYCEMYKTIFRRMEEAAAKLSRESGSTQSSESPEFPYESIAPAAR